ncbi:hypothetical protein [Paludifilum halophilum]|uniref:Uncharacterized protein n=1 Tax=Paludifilum halophilum TaxID=1642702 RepID=A0A235B9D0_9BACL|nr:hypothetical protein [Paludifilum halophilum]OYD08913.1 hypothetical protein CHM34_03785 [Paludifilum halophilum]
MLERMRDRLIRRLISAETCLKVTSRTYAGVPFLYILPGKSQDEKKISQSIRRTAAHLTRHTELSWECSYVRTSGEELVYRFRFLYPDQKSFCCGNQCSDCVLQRRQTKG